jgi:hypothetical protein
MDGETYFLNPQQVISAELSSKEKLLWSGQPPSGFRLRAADAAMIPFSIMWGGFAILWECMVFFKTPSRLFALWGIPFVLVGLYLMIGRFFIDAYLRARTYYGITSNRILIITKGLRPKTVTLDISSLGNLSFAEKRNGGAVIEFGALTPFDGRNRGMQYWSGYASTRFELTEHGRQVYEIIRSAQEAISKN